MDNAYIRTMAVKAVSDAALHLNLEAVRRGPLRDGVLHWHENLYSMDTPTEQHTDITDASQNGSDGEAEAEQQERGQHTRMKQVERRVVLQAGTDTDAHCDYGWVPCAPLWEAYRDIRARTETCTHGAG